MQQLAVIFRVRTNRLPELVLASLWACRKDGVEFPVEINLSPVEITGKMLVWSAIRNPSDRERYIAGLRERAVMENTRLVLGGVISICAWCKRIRDKGGLWERLESSIESHSEAKFTHGICQDCAQKLDPAYRICSLEEGGPNVTEPTFCAAL